MASRRLSSPAPRSGLVIVSGIPGSGKTFLARLLSDSLALPVVDKDDFLDLLFEERGVGDMEWRQSLSRVADERFRAAVTSSARAIACSFWRHPSSGGTAGTPCDWLQALGRPVVEVHCACDPIIARDRFLSRRRHVGHLDHSRNPEDLLSQLRELVVLGPIGIGSPLVVHTDCHVDVGKLAEHVAAELDA